MAQARFTADRAAVAQFLKSAEVEAVMQQHADKVAERAGDGYKATTWQGDGRVIGSVETETIRAMRQNRRDNTLLRALNGGNL